MSDFISGRRRSRRSNIGFKAEAQDELATSTTTPARTPSRRTKRVRFSDPGPSLSVKCESPSSSGLTPMIRRTSIFTPNKRRSSTPARVLSGTPHPASTTTTSAQHDQVLSGRVERRLRRDNVRCLSLQLTDEKKRSTSQIARLRAELKARDQEIYDLQNATIVMDTERVWELEKQVRDLQNEVEARTTAAVTEDDDNDTVAFGFGERSHEWTLAAKDPFDPEFMDLDDGDDHFGETTMGQLMCGTPSRARASFPTPPATSPMMLPVTPSSRLDCVLQTPKTGHSGQPANYVNTDAGVQTSFRDIAEKKQAEDQVTSLHLEMTKLTGTLDSYKSLTGRLTEQLSALPSSSDNIEDSLDQRVAALLRQVSDRAAALSHLTASITSLGFPGNDAAEMLTTLTSGFRAARLELEYLTPGEITLPLTSHGAEVLDLLLDRLRSLATRVKEDEATIDEYHAIEGSLRKQLDARVSVMDGLKAEMAKAESIMNAKNERIKELEIGTERLKGAVGGYIRDISELEKLVESMEEESSRQTGAHSQQLDSKAWLIEELETKLAAASNRASALSQQMADSSAHHKTVISKLNKQHGSALALRDARVSELREEIDRVNASIRNAHETIHGLRVKNSGLEKDMISERAKAKEALDAVKGELQRVLEMSQGFLNTPQKEGAGREGMPSSPLTSGTKVHGGLLSGDLARRGSKKVKRRYDSGLGFLEDEDIDV